MHPDVLPDGEFLVGDVDVLLGVIEGCPFYIDARLHEAWRRAPILRDVEAGSAEGFSLAAGDGVRFTERQP